MLLSRRRRRKPTQRSCCCCPACAAKTAAADHVAVLLLLLWLYLSSPSGGGGGVGCLAFCPHRHRGRSRLRLPQQHCPQNDCRHRREGENLPPPPLVLQLPLPLALNQPRLLQQQQQQRGRGASLLRLLFASWRWRWRWHDHCHRFRDVVRFAPLQQQMRSVLVRARLRLLSLALAAIVASMAVFPAAAMAAAAAAVTAGRAGGGSFGPSSSRSSPSASHHHHRSHHGGGTCTRVFRTGQLPPQIRLYSSPSPPNIIVIQRQRCQQPHLLSRRSTLRNRDDLAAFRWSPGDVLIWVGVGSVITYGFVNNKHKNQGSMIRDDDGGSASALGPGATACHLLLVFLLHRKGPSSGHLLRRIRDRSDRADTTVRKGVQDLVTDGESVAFLSFCLIPEFCRRSAHVIQNTSGLFSPKHGLLTRVYFFLQIRHTPSSLLSLPSRCACRP